MSADFGANDWLVEEMYERYQADPTSVEPSWIEFFKTYNPSAAATTSAPKAGTPPTPPIPAIKILVFFIIQCLGKMAANLLIGLIFSSLYVKS